MAASGALPLWGHGVSGWVFVDRVGSQLHEQPPKLPQTPQLHGSGSRLCCSHQAPHELLAGGGGPGGSVTALIVASCPVQP